MSAIASAIPRVVQTALRGSKALTGRLGGLGTTALVGEGALLAGDVGVPAVRRNLFDDPLGRQIRSEFERRDLLVARMARARRMHRLQMENELLLARQRPDIYNEVIAGRKLPRGAVVLGGTPRRDLMDELVAAMSEGRFTADDPADRDLAALLGR